MAACDTCGNDYENPMTITQQGMTHVFDSFECAIHMMAPSCAHCGVRIIGHGTRTGGAVYCCDHCVPD
jgi:hypothetical protein